MPRFTIFILTLAFVLQRLAVTAHGGIVGEVASYGQKDVITFSELREEAGPKEKPRHETLKGQALVDQIELIRKDIVEAMIDRLLILQEARSKGIELPLAAADVRIEAIIRDKFAGDRLAFARHLAAQGWTAEKFRTRESEQILVEQRRENARAGAATAEDAQRQETDWIKGLRQHAYIKVFDPLYPDVLD